MAELVAVPVVLTLLDKVFSLFGGGNNNRRNKQLQQANESLRNQIEASQKQIDALMDTVNKQKITSLSQLVDKERQTFEAVVSICQQEPAMRLEGNNVGFFGIVSTGKSSLINTLAGEDVAETGIGETTLKYEYYQRIGITYWDCPGKHDNLNYLTADYISLIKGLSQRVIVVDITLKHITGLIRLLQRLGLSFVLVINKYDVIDAASATDKAKFEATIAKEIAEFCPSVPVYRVSSKQPGLFAWDEFVEAITA